MLKKALTYIFCITAMYSAIAQDIHFSNFYTNTLNVNPAETGFFTGHYRFCLAYRDQYRTVAKPYQTVTANFDGQYKKRYWHNVLGYGLILNFDMAGDANYSTFQCGIPLAQHITLYGQKVIVSYGLLPAIHYNSLDYSNLTFSEQFNGLKFDPDIEVSEALETNSNTYFDFSAGMQITYKQKKEITYSVGCAIFNMNQPNVSFFAENDVSLRARTVFHGTTIISATSNIDIIPAFKMQFQGKQHEFHFGGMGIFYFEKANISQVQTGIWFRSKNRDAIIFGIGCQYMNFDIILNYDLNISSLQTASHGHGAFELTLTYIAPYHKKSKRMNAVRCPHVL